MTNVVTITGCEEQGINLNKHSLSLPSILLTKYNFKQAASDAFLYKRQEQGKNCKRVNYASTESEEETGIVHFSLACACVFQNGCFVCLSFYESL